ncbi:MAG: hypothetical protein KDD66_16720 [Bdellovibrionales bacterium]|nr:hypothetical protein [Bdellovibrionales bacterium]
MERVSLETQVFSALSAEAAADDSKDLGFGTLVSANSTQRLINRDGTFNVKRQGHSALRSMSLYHYMLSTTWPRFLLFIVCAYFSLNLLFGLLYWSCGEGALSNTEGMSSIELFWNAFFFSVHTVSTAGFGNTSPVSFAANMLVTFEVLNGLLGFALATGLCFARFSRPTAKIRFSKKAIISSYKDGKAFEFRIINERKNQMFHLKAKVLLSRLEYEHGVRKRRFYDLELERAQVVFFPLHWTIVHPISDTSPLHNVSESDLERSDAEFLIMLEGIDDGFSQTVYCWSSYKFDEIVWGAEYANILKPLEDGSLEVDLNCIDEIKMPAEKAA